MSSKLYLKIVTDLSQTQLDLLVSPASERYEQAQAIVNLLQGCKGGQVAATIEIEDGALPATGTITPSGVQANDTVAVNGVTLTAKVTPTTDVQFKIGTTDLETAQNLRNVINAKGTLQQVVEAEVNSAGKVVVDCAIGGPLGNAITLASSSSSRLAVSGATLDDGTQGETLRYKFNRE